MSRATGSRIGGYFIERILGKGGFGTTYLAHGPAGDRVAIKEIEDCDAGNAINEAQRLCTVSDHPSIVKFRHLIENKFVVMDYIEGQTLSERLDSVGTLKPTQWWACFRRVLEGVAHLHSSNLIHRDIKPDNIVLSHNGPVLIDFGAVRRVGGDLTRVGAPGYAPPEWQSGEMGFYSDIYSLAVVAHEMLFGYEPNQNIMRQNLFKSELKACEAIAYGLQSDGKDRPPTIVDWVCRMVDLSGSGSVHADEDDLSWFNYDSDCLDSTSVEHSRLIARESDGNGDQSTDSDTRTVAGLRDQIVESFVLPKRSIGFLDDESDLVGFSTQVASICGYWSDGDRDHLEDPRANPPANGAHATQRVGNLRKRIEDVCGLPQGCIAILKPDGSRFRADALVRTVRSAHEE